MDKKHLNKRFSVRCSENERIFWSKNIKCVSLSEFVRNYLNYVANAKTVSIEQGNSKLRLLSLANQLDYALQLINSDAVSNQSVLYSKIVNVKTTLINLSTENNMV